MLATSERWADGILEAHQPLVKVTSLASGDELPLVDGSVTLDITGAVRGRCDLTFADPTLIPQDADSVLAPNSKELLVERGLIYPDGTDETVPLGTFGVEDVEVDSNDTATTIKVSGLDRAQRVIDAAFETAYTITGGTDYLTAILTGIQIVQPDLLYSFIARTLTTPELTANEQADRWEFFQTMAEAIGCRLYYDNVGQLVLRAIGSLDNNPVATITEGQDGVEVKPSLLDVTKRFSRTDTHNRWIVTGENPDNDTPPRAVATDDDPNSPTYYFGPFGPKPKFVSYSMISTDDQAQDAANGLKAKEMGIGQSIDFGSLVNPALEPDDVVRVVRTVDDPDDPENPVPLADEDHILDSLAIPLGAGSMTAQTRATPEVV